MFLSAKKVKFQQNRQFISRVGNLSAYRELGVIELSSGLSISEDIFQFHGLGLNQLGSIFLKET